MVNFSLRPWMASVSAALSWKDLSGDPDPGWNTVCVHTAAAIFTFFAVCTPVLDEDSKYRSLAFHICIRHSSKHFPVEQRILKPFQWQLSELPSPRSIICQQMRQDATKSRARIARNDKDFLLPFLLALKIKEAWLGGVTGSKFYLKKRNFLLSEQNKGDFHKENSVFWWLS